MGGRLAEAGLRWSSVDCKLVSMQIVVVRVELTDLLR